MQATALEPIRLSPRVVVFDYGEVISRSPSDADRATRARSACRTRSTTAGPGSPGRFVDNRAENVAGSLAVGGEGHVFTGAADLESWLRGLAS